MTKQYESEVLASVHEAARGMAAAGLMSKRAMRKFDEICLTPVKEMTPEDIRELRLREHASQAGVARYLNVTTGLVSQWERGEKRHQRHLAEAADAGGEERPRCGCVKIRTNRRLRPAQPGRAQIRVRRGAAPWTLNLQSSGSTQRGIR